MALAIKIIVVLWLELLKIGIAVDVGWFWHVTDFHWDTTYYSTGLSCYSQTNRGEYGDPLCDSPWILIQSSVEAMKHFQPDVDFILWTGDSVAHIKNNETTLEKNSFILGNITDLLNSSFPSTPLYATYGNHDYFPSNMYPPYGNELYNKTFEQWRHWIVGAEQERTFRRGAYYTMKTTHGLRIVALNTNLYYTSDKVTEGLTDPAHQFSWLEGVLSSARKLQEKVIITGHVPPGIAEEVNKPWMHLNFHNELNNIILNFSDIIVGMHFGHQHIDDLKVYYKQDVPVGVVFSAPSVTPWRAISLTYDGPARNPGIRLVKYDRQTGKHLDVIQYYLDLQSSNANNKTIWQKGYQMTSDYHLADVTPSSIHALVQRLKNENSKEFHFFNKWRFVNMDRQCDSACHIKIWCSLINFQQSEFEKCMKPSGGASAVG